MEEKTDPIKELEDRLEALRIRQGLLADEIMNLSRAIRRLKADAPPAEPHPEAEAMIAGPDRAEESGEPADIEAAAETERAERFVRREPRSYPALRQLNDNLEDFIGTSLISKIGIIAIVIGVGIGVKYAFDHDLISPPVRVLMGYLAGGTLLFFAYRLRAGYRAFSAVLLSGALAIMYYTSFAAHIYYELLSQGLTFALMVLITIYAVVEALRTDQPVVAHFGLVGAYAVPFLLGDDPDQVVFLFTYMSIVNAGILFIAFQRYWKTLYYAAFVISWLIFFTWYAFDYDESIHYRPALVFLVVFFLLFYLTFLAYKLIRREEYRTSDVAMLLLNAFTFYGIGYLIMQDHETGQDQLGLFTLLNALLHFGVSALVYFLRLADRHLFYLVAGVGLLFATITVPVQLDGNWVTFLWAGEALLLFWIGRAREAPAFEKLSYALFPLALLSLIQDWNIYTGPGAGPVQPVFNVYLLTSLWSSACFGLALLINQYQENRHPLRTGALPRQLLDYGLPVFFLLALYLGFLLEIVHYFEQMEAKAAGSYLPRRLQDIWMLNYSLFFWAILALVNIYRLHNRELGWINQLVNGLLILLFIPAALTHFSALHDLYLLHGEPLWQVLIRYLSYLFAAGLLGAIGLYRRQDFMEAGKRTAYDLLLHLFLLCMAGLELYCWMNSFKATDAFQAGLSILGGLYALLLIGLGIRWSRRHLRVAGIVLVAVTLLKVIFVDLADLDTPTKTVVLVILGGLLLGMSFLYNKFREALFGVNNRESQRRGPE